jgi:CRISPR-associated protein Csx17
MAVLELRGCTPEPLGNYLKGLGVFRLIAEQADPLARAWWKDGFLHVLQTKWGASDSTRPESRLADWLLKECRFTALIAPWQKGTGYLHIGKRDTGGDALTALLKAQCPGTEHFRDVFSGFAASLGVIVGSDQSKWLEEMRESKADLSEAQLLRSLRNRVHSSSTLKWLDAVGMSISRPNDSDFPSWFPILASGGGEASGKYIVNYQKRLKDVLLDDSSGSLVQLGASLLGENQPKALKADSSGAMYYPSLMEAPNVGQGFVSDPKRRVNPRLTPGTLSCCWKAHWCGRWLPPGGIERPQNGRRFHSIVDRRLAARRRSVQRRSKARSSQLQMVSFGARHGANHPPSRKSKEFLARDECSLAKRSVLARSTSHSP